MKVIEIKDLAVGGACLAGGARFSRACAPPGVTTVRVIIEMAGRGRRQLYSATDAATGELLIASSRDPEHDVARVLADRGIVGRLETWWSTSTCPAMWMDISSAARRSVLETQGVGPVIVQWRPFDLEGRSLRSGLIAGGDFEPSASSGANQ